VVILAFFKPRVLLAQKPSDIPEMIKDKEEFLVRLDRTYKDVINQVQTAGGIQSLIDTPPSEEDTIIAQGEEIIR